MAKTRNVTARRTSGRMKAYLRSRRRHLKEELDRIYFTLPYDEIQPVISELKDTVECLNEMCETHTAFAAGAHRRSARRRAVAG
jgi:hypothetical protein